MKVEVDCPSDLRGGWNWSVIGEINGQVLLGDQGVEVDVLGCAVVVEVESLGVGVCHEGVCLSVGVEVSEGC